jgi:hypothetical protein
MGKSFEQHENEFASNPSGKITKVLLWIVGLCMLLGTIFWVLGLLATPAQTAKDVVQKTLNADNVIQNYEWFKEQYNDYLAINVKIANADTSVAHFVRDAGNRKDWSFEDKNEYSRLNSIADGLKYQRADIVGKYNARSKMLNRELFKTSDLPAELN